MTNLSEKLNTLETQLAAHNAAVIDAIGTSRFAIVDALVGVQARIDAGNGKLDTVIDALSGIHTALTSSSGSIDSAPIVTAINQLRGPGPDNTLDRVTSAIFGLAGPAPGHTLTDLYQQIDALRGPSPDNTLERVTSAIFGLAGPAPGRTLTDLYGQLADLESNIGEHTGDATTTLLGLLSSVQFALTHDSTPAVTLYAFLKAASQSLTTPALIGMSVLAELDALRLAQLAAADELSPALPLLSCPSPLESNGMSRLNLPSYATPATAATFDPAQLPAGISTMDGMSLTVANWAQYSVYVASRSTLYGTDPIGTARYKSNKLQIFAGGGTKRFYVDGDSAISVRICPIGAPATGGYIWLTSEVEAVSTGDGIRYLPITTKYSDLTFITGNSPRILLGDWANWRWRITGAGPQAVWGLNTLSSVSNSAEGTITIGNYLVLQSYIGIVQIELLPPL